MPLLDHFHPPLHPKRHWESFHARWAAAIADALNVQLLPRNYFAEVHVHLGGRVEVDVATLHDPDALGMESAAGKVAVAPARPWAPLAATMSIPAVFPDSAEVLVFHDLGDLNLVAAVVLVSPSNKDRPASRRGFAAKCATYLQQGVGLVVIDIVTDQHFNLHNELIDLLGVGKSFHIELGPLYSVAYRPIRRPDDERADVWPVTLALGATLPQLPLALNRGSVPLDLEKTYTDACQRSRLG